MAPKACFSQTQRFMASVVPLAPVEKPNVGQTGAVRFAEGKTFEGLVISGMRSAARCYRTTRTYEIGSPYFFPRGQGHFIDYKFSCIGPQSQDSKKNKCWCRMLVQDVGAGKNKTRRKNILGTFDPHEHVNDSRFSLFVCCFLFYRVGSRPGFHFHLFCYVLNEGHCCSCRFWGYILQELQT